MPNSTVRPSIQKTLSNFHKEDAHMSSSLISKKSQSVPKQRMGSQMEHMRNMEVINEQQTASRESNIKPVISGSLTIAPDLTNYTNTPGRNQPSTTKGKFGT